MVNQPLVCICIPTYNAAGSIRETLTSILMQTYSNFVIHVSDNASSDDTISVIESFNDSRIFIHRNEVNIGGEENFNRCIQLAEGKYTAIFHADDLYQPEIVARQVAFLESHSEAGAVFTEASLIDERGDIFGNMGFPLGMGSFDQLYDFNTLFKAVLKYSNFLICPSVMARTSVYKHDIKRWRGDLFNSSADLDVWLRIAQHHKVGFLPLPLIHYRISAGQFSSSLRSRVTRGDFFLVIDHYLGINNVNSMLDYGDRRNFARLQRTDLVVRATNLYLQGRDAEARKLCGEALRVDAVLAIFSSKRNLVTFSLTLLIGVLLLLRLPQIGRPIIGRLKRFARK